MCEAGNVLLEENTPEAEKVKQRIEDIRGLWDDLKELAIARQEVSFYVVPPPLLSHNPKNIDIHLFLTLSYLHPSNPEMLSLV